MTHTDYMRQWRAKNPEYREYMRRWRETHKDQIRASRQVYYIAHQQETKASAIQWAKDHPLDYAIHQKVAAANTRYPGRICAQDIRDSIDRDGWTCHWCHKAIETFGDFTLEHLEPVNDLEVLTLACRACNAAKLPRLGLTARLERKEYLARRIEKRRAYDRQWKLEHREQINANARTRYWNHVEQCRAKAREYQRKLRAL